jgi:cobalt-precorrin-5B (C1)-methyltransferase
MVTQHKNLVNLRLGFTTGTCASAAAKAAILALLDQKEVCQVTINLPDGTPATFAVRRCIFAPTRAECSVIKDAGDDPDITNGAEIKAAVSWSSRSGIQIRGGEGVGIVTKPGLEVAVGLPAINPVPQRMITAAVRAAGGEELLSRGVEVIISVTDGEKLAKKTLNSRLGIIGGISILGTTGIVIPYSVNAYTACISQALNVAIACGCREVVLTTGRRTERFAQHELGLAPECFIQAGDFIGFSLQECLKKHLAKVIIWGMVGKISKLASGHLYTNISDSSVDISFLTQIAKSCGVSDDVLTRLTDTASAGQLRELIPPEYLKSFSDELCRLAALKCRDSVKGAFEVECIMSDYAGAVQGRASGRK